MANASRKRASNDSYRSGKSRGSGGRWLAFFFGIVFAVAAAAAGGWMYLRFGHPPVAVTDTAFPFEAQIVHIPLNARIAREVEQPPFGTGEDVFEAGARLYINHCAGCHGNPGHDSTYAKTEYPGAPQLWKRHRKGPVVGVSDDEPGETYWKIKHGIRLSGMPAYEHILTTTQMWQVALLLKSADQPLPEPVQRLLAAQ